MRDQTPARTEHGSTVVEFALVFSLLVLPVTFGIVQYGYHYWSLQTGAAAAREAARQLAVGRAWSTCVLPEAQGKLNGPAISAVTVTTEPADLSTLEVGDTVRVDVSFSSLRLGFLPLPNSGLVTESANARVENVPAAPLGCS